MIGLTGSHRTGKTELARRFSKETGVPFVQTGVSQVFKDMGLSPQVVYPIETRMDVQEAILRELCRQYRDVGTGLFIADRTPLDMIAYTLADIPRGNLGDKVEQRVSDYMDKCFEAMNRYFAMVVVVQPGIPLVEDESKAPIGNAYIEHLSHMIFGLAASEKVAASHFYIPRHLTDLDARVSMLKTAYERTLDQRASYMGVNSDEVTLH
jgi:hypothetical protein